MNNLLTPSPQRRYLHRGHCLPELRVFRGGNWFSSAFTLRPSERGINDPMAENTVIGFRVASVPEPSTYALLALAAAGLGGYVLCRRRK